MEDDIEFEEVMGVVLANEATARAMLAYLVKRGVTYHGMHEPLDHADVIDIVLGITTELARRERPTPPPTEKEE